MPSTPLYAVAPQVTRTGEGMDSSLRFDHEQPMLHRVKVRDIGGIGQPNAGDFLVESRCGYKGWVRALNRNPEGYPACENCLNGGPSGWITYEGGGESA